jgi:hypothetical protein
MVELVIEIAMIQQTYEIWKLQHRINRQGLTNSPTTS